MRRRVYRFVFSSSRPGTALDDARGAACERVGACSGRDDVECAGAACGRASIGSGLFTVGSADSVAAGTGGRTADGNVDGDAAGTTRSTGGCDTSLIFSLSHQAAAINA